MDSADWKRIVSIVRPQRYAIFVNETPYWRHACQRIIEIFTQLWGGAGFIIVPTDGESISEPFWSLLINYSPDYLGSYQITFRDLKWADPDKYTKEIQRFSSQIAEEIGIERVESFLEQEETRRTIDGLMLSDRLKKELRDRLAPFGTNRIIDRNNLTADYVPDFPFTRVKNIIQHSKEKPSVVYKHKELKDITFNLMAKMRSGVLTDNFEEEISTAGIPISTSLEVMEARDYIHDLELEETDRYNRAIPPDRQIGSNNLMNHLPNALSMSGLGKYYKLGSDIDHAVTVVAGDSMRDFCYAFSLSKMHSNVHWLPDAPLINSARYAQTKIKARREGREIEEPSEEHEIIRDLISLYSLKIGFGSSPTDKIILTSTSLSRAQLRNRRKKMASLVYTDPYEILNNTFIKPPGTIDVTRIARLMEKNNFANEQAVAFVGGESVERIESIKPKNFKDIDPQNHRWVQSVLVEDYKPPALPGLGEKIFRKRPGRYEVRVAIDGMAYLCPDIAYWGADIDVTLRHPEMSLPDITTIFNHYFAPEYMVLPSDKGKYLMDTVEKFGTLEDAAEFFKRKEYNKLFELFTKEKRENEEAYREERILLDYSSRVYLDFPKIQKILGTSTRDLISSLLEKGVLRRGLILQCQKCSCSAWYDNDDIGQQFLCHRCRTQQLILKQHWKKPEEPNWFYALDEMVYQFYHHNSHITLLGLNKLKGDSVNFDYLPELNLQKLEDNTPPIEIDIACIKEGVVYLGEAKNKRLKTKDLNKYINIYNKFIPSPMLIMASNSRNAPRNVRGNIRSAGLDDACTFLLRDDLYN